MCENYQILPNSGHFLENGNIFIHFFYENLQFSAIMSTIWEQNLPLVLVQFRMYLVR